MPRGGFFMRSFSMKFENLKHLAIVFVILTIIQACSGGDSAPAAPPIEVSVGGLIGAYTSNEIAADEKYKGKWLLVTGNIEEIESGGSFSDPSITFSYGSSFNFDTVRASFSDKSELANVKRREKVTVRCKGDGASSILGLVVNLRDCSLVNN